MMGVWWIKGHSSYAGGIALVAAETYKEAMEIAQRASTWQGMDYLHPVVPEDSPKLLPLEVLEDYPTPCILALEEWGE